MTTRTFTDDLGYKFELVILKGPTIDGKQAFGLKPIKAVEDLGASEKPQSGNKPAIKQVDNLSVVFERRNKIKDRLMDRRKWKAYHDAGGMYLADVNAERAEEISLIQELEMELEFLNKLLQEQVIDLAKKDGA